MSSKRTIFHAHAAVENLGDRLIVEAIRAGLRERAPELELEFTNASPGRASASLLLSQPLDPAVREALRAADLLLIGGGELVGPYAGYLCAALEAAAMGMPVVWLGVGGRLGGGRLDRFYMRTVLRQARAVITRDPETFSHLAEVVAPDRLHDGVDVALAWTPPGEDTKEPGDEFGICLRGPERRERPWDRTAFRQLAREIQKIAQRGLRPVFFSFLSEEDARRIGSPNRRGSFTSDDEVNYLVMKELGDPPPEVVVADGDIERVTSRLRSLRFLIGMRLHALILSAHCKVPFIALDYAPKVAEFARLVGAEDQLVRPEQVASHVPPLAARLCDPAVRAVRSAALAAAMEPLRRRAAAQLEAVTELLRQPRARARRRTVEAAARLATQLMGLHARI